jgi:hypothetical protein
MQLAQLDIFLVALRAEQPNATSLLVFIAGPRRQGTIDVTALLGRQWYLRIGK